MSFAQSERSKCARRSVRMQQSCRMNMSLCAQAERESETLVCMRRENAAVLSHEHVSVRTESEIQVCSRHASVRMQQSFGMNVSLCARREIQPTSTCVIPHSERKLFIPKNIELLLPRFQAGADVLQFGKASLKPQRKSRRIKHGAGLGDRKQQEGSLSSGL